MKGREEGDIKKRAKSSILLGEEEPVKNPSS
jgi:hypothetical protein